MIDLQHREVHPENACSGFSVQESGYRFYRSDIGRWVSRDPIHEPGLAVFFQKKPSRRREVSFRAQGVNRLLAFRNNTQSYYDANGLFAENGKIVTPLGKKNIDPATGKWRQNEDCGPWDKDSPFIIKRGPPPGYRAFTTPLQCMADCMIGNNVPPAPGSGGVPGLGDAADLIKEAAEQAKSGSCPTSCWILDKAKTLGVTLGKALQVVDKLADICKCAPDCNDCIYDSYPGNPALGW